MPEVVNAFILDGSRYHPVSRQNILQQPVAMSLRATDPVLRLDEEAFVAQLLANPLDPIVDTALDPGVPNEELQAQARRLYRSLLDQALASLGRRFGDAWVEELRGWHTRTADDYDYSVSENAQSDGSSLVTVSERRSRCSRGPCAVRKALHLEVRGLLAWHGSSLVFNIHQLGYRTECQVDASACSFVDFSVDEIALRKLTRPLEFARAYSASLFQARRLLRGALGLPERKPARQVADLLERHEHLALCRALLDFECDQGDPCEAPLAAVDSEAKAIEVALGLGWAEVEHLFSKPAQLRVMAALSHDPVRRQALTAQCPMPP